MKTHHTIANRTIINNRARVRSILSVAGIVVAVLCSLVLWKEARSAERMETKAPRLVELTRVTATGLIGEVAAWM